DPCPKETPGSSQPPVSVCDRILLLSEWDTAYGRDLPDSVANAFDTDDSSFGGCRLSPAHGIMHASYLRGLDGRLPGRRSEREAKPADGDGNEQPGGGGPSATPDTTDRFQP